MLLRKLCKWLLENIFSPRAKHRLSDVSEVSVEQDLASAVKVEDVSTPVAPPRRRQTASASHHMSKSLSEIEKQNRPQVHADTPPVRPKRPSVAPHRAVSAADFVSPGGMRIRRSPDTYEKHAPVYAKVMTSPERVADTSDERMSVDSLMSKSASPKPRRRSKTPTKRRAPLPPEKRLITPPTPPPAPKTSASAAATRKTSPPARALEEPLPSRTQLMRQNTPPSYKEPPSYRKSLSRETSPIRRDDVSNRCALAVSSYVQWFVRVHFPREHHSSHCPCSNPPNSTVQCMHLHFVTPFN